MSDIEFYRDNEEPHETVEVRYLNIPGRELASNGLREIDEIVYRDLHLETEDINCAYITVAGMRFKVWASRVKGHVQLSITCEPDDATLLPERATQPGVGLEPTITAERDALKSALTHCLTSVHVPSNPCRQCSNYVPLIATDTPLDDHP